MRASQRKHMFPVRSLIFLFTFTFTPHTLHSFSLFAFILQTTCLLFTAWPIHHHSDALDTSGLWRASMSERSSVRIFMLLWCLTYCSFFFNTRLHAA